MNDAVQAWWQGLGPRERRIVGWGAALVAAVAVWAWLWEPAASGIRKLQGDLPVLRAQDASMRAMVDEVARLRLIAGRAVPIAAGERIAAVRRSLERAGLGSANAAGAPVASTQSGTVTTLSAAGATTTLAAAPVARGTPPDVTADGDRIRVRFDDVDYGIWVAWLASTEAELAARASRVSIATTAPKGPVGHVRAEATLDFTPPPARS